MDLAAKSSERLSAALFTPRRSQRAWSALRSSSKSPFSSTFRGHAIQSLTCIRGMQDCFREHPEMYGSELEDDEEEVEEELRVQAAEKEAASPVQSEAAPIASIAEQATAKLTTEESITVAKSDDKTKKGGDQGSELVPKDAVDAPAQN